MTALQVWIDGVGLLGPGLDSWAGAQAVLRGAATPATLPTVLPIPVRLPAAGAIAEFTERVRPLFALRDQLAEENDALSALRDYLLPRLLAGALMPVPKNGF